MEIFSQWPALYPYQPEGDLSQVYIIGVQHILETTGSMIEQVLKWGIAPGNIFLLGKNYSTHQDTLRKLLLLGVSVKNTTAYFKPGYFDETFRVDVASLWQRLWQVLPERATIIILDDGGHTLVSIPGEVLKGAYTIIGIEQTTSGIWKLDSSSVPVINVAQSAVKKFLEPDLVSKALQRKIRHIIREHDSHTIGILGCGNIGTAIIKNLSNDYDIHAYDYDFSRMKGLQSVHKHDNSDVLFEHCDTIIGATGHDISSTGWLETCNSDKLLISASSGDKEFNSLLREYVKRNGVAYPLDHLTLKTEHNHNLTFFRGGTVANFDGSAHSVPPEEIQLTRGLLYAALIQALEIKDREHGHHLISLSAVLQKKIVNLWWDHQPMIKKRYSDLLIQSLESLEWIEKHSG